MQEANKTGRQVGYHRTGAEEAFSQIQCYGESFSRVFVDQEISLDSSRPELRKMIAYLEEDDCVVVGSLDCLGYCFADLESVITMILDKGCSVRVRDERLTFRSLDDGEGQSMLHMLRAFVRAERPMLSGLLHMTTLAAKEKKTFAANTRASATPQEACKLQEMKKAGVPITALQEEFNLSRGAINRILMTA